MSRNTLRLRDRGHPSKDEAEIEITAGPLMYVVLILNRIVYLRVVATAVSTPMVEGLVLRGT